ncbi:MAG: class I SAM-dependent methyltransferase [Bacteroidota bacterium]
MSWYQHWFADELYMELYAHRDASEARQAIDLFERVTGLRPEGSSASANSQSGDHRENAARPNSETTSTPPQLLDLACGTGRHSFELARRGYRIAAADLSPTLLAAAARKTQRYRERLWLVRADMRRLPFAICFGAVLQLFTAFGYFPSDAANEAVIAGVRSVLLPGGWYMLDFLNASAVASTLEARTEQITLNGNVVQERSIREGRVEKRISITGDDRAEVFTESVRLFELADFEGMFLRSGFSLTDVRGNYDGSPHNADSPRCIMFARAV